MTFWNSVQGTLLLIALGAGVLVFLWVKGYRSVVKKIVLALVIEAEKKYGNGTGEFKYAYVVGLVYTYIPAVLRVFLSEKALDQAIEAAVQYMKDQLAKSEKLAAAFAAQLPN